MFSPRELPPKAPRACPWSPPLPSGVCKKLLVPPHEPSLACFASHPLSRAQHPGCLLVSYFLALHGSFCNALCAQKAPALNTVSLWLGSVLSGAGRWEPTRAQNSFQGRSPSYLSPITLPGICCGPGFVANTQTQELVTLEVLLPCTAVQQGPCLLEGPCGRRPVEWLFWGKCGRGKEGQPAASLLSPVERCGGMRTSSE